MEAAAYPIEEEKPEHYRYLKNFRTTQCKQFLAHRCDKTKPFTCFDWHYQNQRRRVPKRDTKDGHFNYSATEYCTLYDVDRGTCPSGDKCRLLHKTSGEVEKLYHLRYYKTEKCQHPLDAKGHCVRNGPHCAFAHGDADLRKPVYDAAELQSAKTDKAAATAATGASRSTPAAASVGSATAVQPFRPTAGVQRPSTGSAEPDWSSLATVLTRYKTDQCPLPAKSCKGQYCPKYHTATEKRRSPYMFNYRPQPCADVKVGDRWNDPASCSRGDKCQFSHTRNEQQFHPEVYKSVICGDYHAAASAGRSCRRGEFCAFAHGDEERASVDRSRGVPPTTSQSQPTFSVPTPIQPAPYLPPPPGLRAPAVAAALPVEPLASVDAMMQLTSTKTATPAKATAPVHVPSWNVAGDAEKVNASMRSLVMGSTVSDAHDAEQLAAPAKPPRAGPPVVAAAGGSTTVAAGNLVTVEELIKVIDADTTIDILEKKRRKRLLSDVAGPRNTVTFDRYSEVISDSPELTVDFTGLGGTGNVLLQTLEDMTALSSVASGYTRSSLAVSENLLNRHDGKGSEMSMEDRILQMLLEAKSLLNPTKLNDLSTRDLRAIRKQLQQQMELVEEAIQEKLDRSGFSLEAAQPNSPRVAFAHH